MAEVVTYIDGNGSWPQPLYAVAKLFRAVKRCGHLEYANETNYAIT